MGDVKGFLKHGRETPTRRPVPVRLLDWKEVYEEFPDRHLRVNFIRLDQIDLSRAAENIRRFTDFRVIRFRAVVDALAADDRTIGRVLEPHALIADRLGRLDEGAADVVIADDAEFIRDA